MKKLIIAIFLLAFSFISCTQKHSDFPGWEKLKKGMTINEISSALNIPTMGLDTTSMSQKSNAPYFRYIAIYLNMGSRSLSLYNPPPLPDKSKAYIIFLDIDDKLVAWREPILQEKKWNEKEYSTFKYEYGILNDNLIMK